MNYLQMLEKLAAGTASGEEQMQWKAWLQTADEATLRKVMLHWEEVQASQKADAAADELLFTQITSRLVLEDTKAGVVHTTGFRNRLQLWVAAAVLLLVAGSWWYLFAHREVVKAPAIVAGNDIAPGTDRAVLTLADGRTLILDSATQGKLASENGLLAIQDAAGSLHYQSGETNSDITTTGYNTLQTPRGGQFKLTLPDGTRVWLNSASGLRYALQTSQTNREVFLSGEAYFEVAADKSRPFIVKTANQEIAVLGTRFNVNAYDDEPAARTTLQDGLVQVKDIRPSATSVLPDVLKPGQQAVVPYDAAAASVNTPDLQEVLAWKEGEFRFHNASITTIMRQIKRWYNVDVEYQGAVPAASFYGVIPRKEYVSQLLKALALTKNVHFKTTGNKIIVMAGSD